MTDFGETSGVVTLIVDGKVATTTARELAAFLDGKLHTYTISHVPEIRRAPDPVVSVETMVPHRNRHERRRFAAAARRSR